LLLVSLWALMLSCRTAGAEIRVGFGIGIDLPLFTFTTRPALVPVPGSYAYYVPGIEEEILYCQGHWYRPWGNRWHRAVSYNGPWISIGPRYLPGALLRLPSDYRHSEFHGRPQYTDLTRQRRGWGHGRYREREHDGWRGQRESRYEEHRYARDERHEH
jgi:hypothetical protein